MALVVIGIGLLLGMLFSAYRGDIDRALMFGIALLTGMSGSLALVLAIVLALIFVYKGDYRKSLCAILGFVLGVVLFAGVVAMLVGGGLIEGGAEWSLA